MSIFRMLPAFPGGKVKAFTLSYDDGVKEDAGLIALMEKYGIKGTFNLNSGNFCGGFGDHEVAQETVDTVVARYDSPNIEIAGHGVNHPILTELPAADRFRELAEDRVNLERIFGRMVTGHAYPCGARNPAVKDDLRRLGYHYARGVDVTHAFDLPTDWFDWCGTCRNVEDEMEELGDAFLAAAPDCNHPPIIFYLWGHAFEFDSEEKWDRIEKFFKEMAGKEDIWYATNGEICDYLHDFALIKTTADGHGFYNPTARDLFVRVILRKDQDYFDLAFPVPAGRSVSLDKEVLA